MAWLNSLYTVLPRRYNNCFQPVMKLVGKADGGAQNPQDLRPAHHPAARVLDRGRADPQKIHELVSLYTSTSPLALKRRLDRRLAAMPADLEVPQSA